MSIGFRPEHAVSLAPSNATQARADFMPRVESHERMAVVRATGRHRPALRCRVTETNRADSDAKQRGHAPTTEARRRRSSIRFVDQTGIMHTH